MANALVKQTENTQPAPLKAVEGRHIPKGLAEIKALMGSERHTPEYVYTKVLSEQERTIVCFAAGFFAGLAAFGFLAAAFFAGLAAFAFFGLLGFFAAAFFFGDLAFFSPVTRRRKLGLFIQNWY